MAQPPHPTSPRPIPTSATDSPIDPGDILRAAMGRRENALSLFRRAAAIDPPIDRLITAALHLALHSLQVDRCFYAVRDAEGGDFWVAAAIGWPEEVIGRASLSGLPESLGGHTLRVDRAVIVENLSQVSAFGGEPLLESPDTRSALTAPVRGQREMSGLLGAFSSRQRLFSPDEADFLLGLAEVITAALYRADWRNHLRRARPHRPAARHSESHPR